MAGEPVGYLLSPDNYRRVGETVNAYERTGRAGPAMRRRGAIFQPVAGGKVYQCIYGTALRPGTVASPEDTSIYEPVALCVYLGTTGDDDLWNLRNDDVQLLQSLVVNLNIVGSDNLIVPDVFDEMKDDESITSITSEQLSDDVGLTALRTRFCQGYVGTGSVVIGNDTEAWYTVGPQVFEATIKKAWTDGTKNVQAKVTFNQGALDAGVSNNEIYDHISIRNPAQSAVFMNPEQPILVEFNQQEFFSDDDSYEDRFWFKDDVFGWLPVFNIVNLPPTIAITHTATETDIPPYGAVLEATGSDPTTGYLKVKRPDTYGSQWNAIVNGPATINAGESGDAQGGHGPFIAAYDPADGTPAFDERWGPRNATYLLKKNTGGFKVIGVVDSTKHLVLVDRDPMLSVRGTIASDCAPDTAQDLTVNTGPYGSESSTGQTITGIRNASDCTLKSGSGAKIHRAVYDWSVPGWEFDVGRTT